MGRILTLRGVLSRSTYDQIMMFDSTIKSTGWKVLDFRIQNQDNSRPDIIGLLHTDDVRHDFLDWDPNQVIACADISAAGYENVLLDYNHVIVSDLFISNASTNFEMNYLVVLEEVAITPQENIIYQLKEIAQTTN